MIRFLFTNNLGSELNEKMNILNYNLLGRILEVDEEIRQIDGNLFTNENFKS